MSAIAVIGVLIAWYAVGALGSEIARRTMNGRLGRAYPKHHVDEKWGDDPIYPLMALGGPANLIGALLYKALWR